MSKVADIILRTYLDHAQARQPELMGMNPPDPEPYDRIEVSNLIHDIMHKVDSYLAQRFLERRNNEQTKS